MIKNLKVSIPIINKKKTEPVMEMVIIMKTRGKRLRLIRVNFFRNLIKIFPLIREKIYNFRKSLNQILTMNKILLMISHKIIHKGYSLICNNEKPI